MNGRNWAAVVAAAVVLAYVGTVTTTNGQVVHRHVEAESLVASFGSRGKSARPVL